MTSDLRSRPSDDTRSNLVSLGRLLRGEEGENVTAEDSYRSLCLYWDSRESKQSSRAIFGALFTQRRRIALLKSLSKALSLNQTEREVKTASNIISQRTQVIHSQAGPLASKDAQRSHATRSLLDIHRMTRRIQIKLRPHFSSSVEQLTTTLLSDGIHERMRNFLAKVVDTSHVRRCRKIDNVQPSKGSASNVYAWKPKEKIREINTTILHKASLRSEKERQKLLQLGEQTNKRKRLVSDELDEDLLIRAEKAREEEEERKLADAANEATRSALGEAKYLKWFTEKPKENQSIHAKLQSSEKAAHDRQKRKDAVESLATTNTEGFRGNISCVDILTVLKSEKVLCAVWPRVIHIISASKSISTS